MKKLKKLKNNSEKYSELIDGILFCIFVVAMVLWFIVIPCTVAYGVTSGYLDIETLQPVRNEVQYERY